MQLKDYRRAVAARLLQALSKKINDYQYNSALLDADILLEYVTHEKRSFILAHGEKILSDDEIAAIEKVIEIREAGKPIAYITHQKEFFAFDFFVDERVLIPKSDTEPLVEQAALFCGNAVVKSSTKFNILDACCGSGCIGIALVKTIADMKLQTAPRIRLTLLDISPDALEVSRINASAILQREIAGGFVTVDFLKADLADGFDGKFDCIVSNPPYVPTKIAVALLEDGRSEPMLALDGGDDGLQLFPKLATGIKNALAENGAFFVECGEYNIDAAYDIFFEAGLHELKIHKDLNNQKRIISGKN